MQRLRTSYSVGFRVSDPMTALAQYVSLPLQPVALSTCVSPLFGNAMACLTMRNRAILSSFIYLVLATVVLCQCNTDQNPYCAGNSQFEQLCCTYPNICYWSNRAGTPACCQAGADCRGDGGPAPAVVAFTAAQQTTYLIQTVYTTTQPQYSTTTSYYVAPYSSWSTTTYYQPSQLTSFTTIATPAVVIVTTSAAVVAPANTNNVFVTVTQVQVVAGAPSMGMSTGKLVKGICALVATYGLAQLI